MALAIVPSIDNSVADLREFDVHDDFNALVHELMADEQLTQIEASSQALALVDDLSAYAASWDADAHLAGHTDGRATLPLNTVVDMTPSQPRRVVLIE